jgi:urease accessory protein
MAPPRAKSVIATSELANRTPFDTIVLPHDGRHRRRITMRTEGDFVFLLDLPEATHLRHGDGLLLEDGRVIGVVAADEPVADVTAPDAHHLARLAWHIGNRHVPAEILADRIRIAPDPIIEEMARGLGGTVTRLEARFEPEGGAYEHASAPGHAGLGHGHEHAHDHACAQPHGHDHGHGHQHAHGHDHAHDRHHEHCDDPSHDHAHGRGHHRHHGKHGGS